MVCHKEHILVQTLSVDIDARTKHAGYDPQIEHCPRGWHFQQLPQQMEWEQQHQWHSDQQQSRSAQEIGKGFLFGNRNGKSGQVLLLQRGVQRIASVRSRSV